MSTIELTTKNFEAAVTKNGITIVDFWASWCAPCRLGNKKLVKLHNEANANKIEIISTKADN